MRVVFAMIKTNLKLMIQYKWGFLVSLIADPIVMVVNIALFSTIYSYNNETSILGYSLSQMIWYFTGVTFIWYFIWNFTDQNIASKILSGDLAMDLLKPTSIFKLQFSEAIALRTTGIMFEVIPGFIIFRLIFYPDFMTVLSILRFLAVVVMAFTLFFLINFLVGLTAFVIKSNFSLRSIKAILISITAGAYIPLEFFPPWLNRINDFLPFKYLFYWPIQFFINRGDAAHAETLLRILGIQILWAVGLFALCKFLWKLSIRKFCAVG